MSYASYSLPYTPPFDWIYHLDFLDRHLVFGVEEVAEGVYSRLIEGSSGLGRVKLALHHDKAALHLEIADLPLGDHPKVIDHIRAMFGLEVNPNQITNLLSQQPTLAPLAQRHPGLRIARGWDTYETSIAAILGQLVSVAQSKALVKQLLLVHGRPVEHQGEVKHLFPSPETLAEASLDALGTTRIRKTTIRTFSRFFLENPQAFQAPVYFSDLRHALLALPGIGPWTADYIGLRALGEEDAFPGTDLILKRALELHPEIDPAALAPKRGYLAILLWKAYAVALSKTGKLKKKAHTS